MEPNKLEQDFRHKLEQRTIQPTEMAWDRLDAMLSVTEEKKKKPSRTWMYMAASFLAFLLVGVLLLNQENKSADNVNAKDNRVTVSRSEQETSIGEISKPTVIDSQVVKKQDVVASTKNDAPVNNQVPVFKTDTTKRNPVPVVTKNVVALNEVPANVKQGPAKITVNAGDLLASVEAPAMADQIAATGKPKKQMVKVDPNSLLTSVEGELNDSFRGKVLQSVAKNYNIIKSSVASRNRQ